MVSQADCSCAICKRLATNRSRFATRTEVDTSLQLPRPTDPSRPEASRVGFVLTTTLVGAFLRPLVGNQVLDAR
jgi:hypothetical protein